MREDSDMWFFGGQVNVILMTLSLVFISSDAEARYFLEFETGEPIELSYLSCSNAIAIAAIIDLREEGLDSIAKKLFLFFEEQDLCEGNPLPLSVTADILGQYMANNPDVSWVTISDTHIEPIHYFWPLLDRTWLNSY